MRYPLFGIGQTSKSVSVTAESRTNLYLEFVTDEDKSKVIAYGTPGLDLFTSFGDTPVRGGMELGDYNYVVHRGTLWEVNNAAVAINRGTLDTTSGRVSMTNNGNTLQIVDGSFGYTYNTTTNVFTKITDVNFVPAQTNTWIDGYFITDQRGSTDKTKWGRYSWSTDGLTYNALNFASAEANPDKIVRVYNDNRELVLFGDVTTEFHSNSGALDLPFVRQAVIEWGLAAVNSVAKMNGSIIYLGRNRMGKTQVLVLNGYTPQEVSNQEISNTFDSYGDISNASGYSYMLGGHPMYVLNFPTVGKSWLYDGSTNLWSKLSSGLTQSQYLGNFANTFTVVSKVLVYDYANGNIYTINANTYTDNGAPIVREMSSRHIFDEKYHSIGRIWLDMETGVGLVNGQGSNPQVMLKISKNGGRTAPVERWAALGKIGSYIARVIWNRLGAARDFVVTARITDPVKVVIIGAWVDML